MLRLDAARDQLSGRHPLTAGVIPLVGAWLPLCGRVSTWRIPAPCITASPRQFNSSSPGCLARSARQGLLRVPADETFSSNNKIQPISPYFSIPPFQNSPKPLDTRPNLTAKELPCLPTHGLPPTS
jgi:hypothetical protein